MKIKKRDDNGGCTIVIPTYNRSYYLKRLLSYYNEYLDRNKYKIIIADSSSCENKKQNKKIIEQFPGLGILYLNEYPADINMLSKICSVLCHIKSEYCVICADDDFITPQGIEQSISFLKKNDDFTVVYGLGFAFWLKHAQENKQHFYRGRIIQHSSVTFSEPKERLIYHLLNYVPTFYGVHRSDFLRTIFKELKEFTSDPVFGELFLSMLTLIYGKMKCLDVFYTARDKGGNIKSNRQVFWLNDFIKKGCFKEKYSKFKEGLLIHLSKKYQSDALDIEELKTAIDDAMSIYLANYMKGIKSAKKKLLICEIKDILNHFRITSWMYGGIRLLYRKLFPACQIRMDDLVSSTGTPPSEHYEEIQHIYNHLLLFPIADKKGHVR
ncbi:MAG: TIGR00180 family glycosyltransferase [Candidatus Omnitrophica bacterium]|nr:TIGR00180 family glycosyltransferase [Candidatus Omnitrophota bacterium]MDD5591867.1 TIGR00180 family glycosyltransferase [Candidatus Omnitrophota bacterium]